MLDLYYGQSRGLLSGPHNFQKFSGPSHHVLDTATEPYILADVSALLCGRTRFSVGVGSSGVEGFRLSSLGVMPLLTVPLGDYAAHYELGGVFDGRAFSL